MKVERSIYPKRIIQAVRTTVFLTWLVSVLSPMGHTQQITPDNVLDYCLEIIHAAQKEFPRSPDVYIAEGYAYYRSQKYEKAMQSYLKADQLHPRQSLVVEMIAFLYSRLNQFDKAVEWYQKAIEIKPDSPRANERLGLALQKLNRMEEATQAFEREVKYHPQDGSAHVYLGERYLADNRLEEAEEQANLAIQAEPTLPEPYYLLSKIYKKKGNAAKAKEILKVFQEKKKNEHQFFDDSVGIISDQQQAFYKASQTHLELGTLYYHAQQLQKAIYHYNRALSLNPKDEIARYNLALIYQDAKQYDKAASLFQELLAIDANEPRFLLGMGLIRSSQKRWTEAQGYIEKVLAAEPDHVPAIRALVHILLSSNRDRKKALTLAQKIAEKGGEAEDYNLLGWAYYANGHAKESLQAMSKAISKAPNNSAYKERYNKILARIRRE